MRHLSLVLTLCGSLLLASCATSSPNSPVPPAGFHVSTTAPGCIPDCKVTGGGFIYACNGDKITFGFNAFGQQQQQVLHGNIEVNDHSSGGEKYHSNELNVLWCDATSVTFGGTLSNGDNYVAYVVDNGEPGTADTFSFAEYDASWNLVYSASGTLQGGNVQIHPTH